MKKTKKHPFVAAMINFEYNGISRMVEPRDCHDAKKLENWWFKNRDKTDSSLLAEFEEIQKISSRLLVKYTLGTGA